MASPTISNLLTSPVEVQHLVLAQLISSSDLLAWREASSLNEVARDLFNHWAESALLLIQSSDRTIIEMLLPDAEIIQVTFNVDASLGLPAQYRRMHETRPDLASTPFGQVEVADYNAADDSAGRFFTLSHICDVRRVCDYWWMCSLHNSPTVTPLNEVPHWATVKRLFDAMRPTYIYESCPMRYELEGSQFFTDTAVIELFESMYVLQDGHWKRKALEIAISMNQWFSDRDHDRYGDYPSRRIRWHKLAYPFPGTKKNRYDQYREAVAGFHKNLQEISSKLAATTRDRNLLS